MPGITLEQAQSQLEAALTAHTAILQGGTEYRVAIPGGGERLLKCPPLAEVQASIEFWQRQVQSLIVNPSGLAGGPRIYGASI